MVINKLEKLQWGCPDGEGSGLAGQDNHVLVGVVARTAAFSSLVGVGTSRDGTAACSSAQCPDGTPWTAAPRQLRANSEASTQPSTRQTTPWRILPRSSLFLALPAKKKSLFLARGYGAITVFSWSNSNQMHSQFAQGSLPRDQPGIPYFSRAPNVQCELRVEFETHFYL